MQTSQTKTLNVERAEGDENSIRVLMYHRIVPDGFNQDSLHICLPRKTFVRQMQFLDQWGYTAITFKDYKLYLEGKLNLPKKPVIITFDDAYVETYHIAYPVLQNLGMKAVIFVLGDMSIRENIWDSPSKEASELLSEHQIIEMHEAGFEIGSHSYRHPRLTLLSKKQAWEEISRSRMSLEIFLNSPVVSFAYPFGLTNAWIKQMVRDAGYTIGCSSYSGPPAFSEDRFEIRRIKAPDTGNPVVFWSLLRSWYSYYRWLRWRCIGPFLLGEQRKHLSRNDRPDKKQSIDGTASNNEVTDYQKRD